MFVLGSKTALESGKSVRVDAAGLRKLKS